MSALAAAEVVLCHATVLPPALEHKEGVRLGIVAQAASLTPRVGCANFGGGTCVAPGAQCLVHCEGGLSRREVRGFVVEPVGRAGG